MELNFESVSCRCLRQKAREVQNQEQTQEIRLPDGLPDIGRVLCCWGQVILRSKEWHSDGMTATGGVMVWVLYVPDDGSQPQCVDGWLPFQMKWDFPETQREGTIWLQPLLRSADARTVSARKLMVKTNVGVLAEALEPWETQVCRYGEEPENVQLLRQTYPLRLTIEAGEKTFVLDEELTLPESCPNAAEILRYELQPRILEQKVMAGKVVFRGNGMLHVLCRGEEGQLFGWDFELPFSQFGDLEGDYSQDAAARLTAAVTNLELDRTDGGALRLKCGLVCQYIVTDQMMVEVAEDAYGINRKLKPSFDELKLPAILEERDEKFNVEIMAELECGRVLDVNFMPDHPRIHRVGDQVNGELNGIFQLLYEDREGTLQSAIRRWESAWPLVSDSHCGMYMELADAQTDTAAMNASGITLRSGIAATARTVNEQGWNMITGLELGEMEQPDPARPSLILRRTEGERLWDLAKSCGTTVAAICQANQLQAEPQQGQLLLIPIQ